MHREAATITNLPNFRSVLPGHFSPTRECVTISPWPTQHADASSRPLSARRARRDFARCLITLPLLLHPPGSFQAPRAFLLYRRVRSNNSMDRLFRRRRVPAIPLTRCWLNTVLSLFVALPALAQTGSVVISQVYGGGGNTGAPLQADFIELFNRSEATVALTGWTVQYASAAGTTWDSTAVSGNLRPGQYYLVQENVGSVGASIPSPDAIGGINLSATAGKIALVAGNLPLSGSAPGGAQVIDFVGYGSANAAEGAPAPSLNNFTAILRHLNGCTDTNNNAADFVLGVPNPRNRGAALNSCSASSKNPVISAAGIGSAASLVAGPIAPGEIVIIYGSGLGPAVIQGLQLSADGQAVTNSLAGTRVLFAGTPAPLIFARADVVSAIVPYSVRASTSVDVQVEFNGVLSNRVTVGVTQTVPAIFTADSSGQGLGVIQNADYSTNGPSRRAALGSFVIIYATGAGETDPIAPDGVLIGTPLPTLRHKVTVRIDGMDAGVLYSGPAPELVNGVFLIIAGVPTSLPHGGLLPLEVRVDEVASQPGVTVAVDGPEADPPGTGPLIDQRLAELQVTTVPAALPEIPNDRVAIPSDWLALVSWNTQVGGTSTDVGAPRPPMIQAVLSTLFGGTYRILAAQEVPNADSANLLTSLLPQGTTNWRASFFDSTDTMDNGFWFQRSVTLRDAFLLNVTNQILSDEIVTDLTRALHPPQVAQFAVDDFDFTLVTVHLTFADGNTAESARELRSVLDYLDWYFNQSDHDPDVIVCGDFNMPSLLSKQQGRDAVTLDAVFQQDARFQLGERRFVVTVHEPTSRSSAAQGGLPVSNYDHCVLSADTLKAFIQARRVDTTILTDNPQDPEVRLTSDHFPVVAFFRTRGTGIALDRKFKLRPPN